MGWRGTGDIRGSIYQCLGKVYRTGYDSDVYKRQSFWETAIPEEKRLTEDFPLCIEPGRYHHFGYETDEMCIRDSLYPVTGECRKQNR